MPCGNGALGAAPSNFDEACGLSIRSVRHRLPDALLPLIAVEGVRVDPLRDDFNEHGAAGWEFCAVADGYAIFKRPAAT
jgi:hypothetical protein